MGARSGLGGCLLLSALALAQGEAAGDAGTFHASAEASGASVVVSAPEFLIAEKLADVAAPKAEAALDGLGTSRALASYPYPGEAALTTPGLVAASTGLPSPPGYPFVASSAFPSTPEAKVDQPGYRLEARSAEAESSAQATAGAEPAGLVVGLSSATAEAARDAGSGVVSAASSALARTIEVAGVFQAGTITAQARISQTPGAPLVRESRLSAEALTVAGQQVALSEEGLVLAETEVPLADTASVAKALADAGVGVRYLAPVELPDGVVSAGLAVTQRQQAPNGPVVITELVFGRAVARGAAAGGGDDVLVVPGAEPFASAPGSEQPAPALDLPAASVPSPAFVVPPIATIAPIGASGFLFGSDPAATGGAQTGRLTPSLTDGSAPPSPPVPDAPSSAAAPVAIGRVASPASGSGSYAVLVVGAGIAFVLSQLLRRLGVRSA
jgi:hypothetical protein